MSLGFNHHQTSYVYYGDFKSGIISRWILLIFLIKMSFINCTEIGHDFLKCYFINAMRTVGQSFNSLHILIIRRRQPFLIFGTEITSLIKDCPTNVLKLKRSLFKDIDISELTWRLFCYRDSYGENYTPRFYSGWSPAMAAPVDRNRMEDALMNHERQIRDRNMEERARREVMRTALESVQQGLKKPLIIQLMIDE